MKIRWISGTMIGSVSALQLMIVMTGCTAPAKRNGSLQMGGQSAIVEATQQTIDGADTSRGSALGTMPARQDRSFASRLSAPFQGMNNPFKKKPSSFDQANPLSLTNPTGEPTPELMLSAARVIASSGRNLENAKEMYRQALVAYPNDRDTMMELARLHAELGEMQDASELYRRAVDAHPNDPVVFNDVGLFHQAQDRNDLALNAFSRAVELDGQRAIYRNNLANLFVIMGQDRRAFEQLAVVHPRPMAHYHLGSLLYQQRRLYEAIEQFDLAFAADERFYDAHVMKTQLIQELQQQQSRAERYSEVMQVSYLQDMDGESELIPAAMTSNDEPIMARASGVQIIQVSGPSRMNAQDHRAGAQGETGTVVETEQVPIFEPGNASAESNDTLPTEMQEQAAGEEEAMASSDLQASSDAPQLLIPTSGMPMQAIESLEPEQTSTEMLFPVSTVSDEVPMIRRRRQQASRAKLNPSLLQPMLANVTSEQTMIEPFSGQADETTIEEVTTDLSYEGRAAEAGPEELSQQTVQVAGPVPAPAVLMNIPSAVSTPLPNQSHASRPQPLQAETVDTGAAEIPIIPAARFQTDPWERAGRTK